MSDAPLTEKRFLELLELRLSPIDSTLKDFKKEFIIINETLKNLEGFQKKESKAIEFELKMLLEKYIEKEYGLMTKIPLIGTITNPLTNQPLTDFDAAFLLTPIKKHIDYSRLREAGINNVKYTKDIYEEEDKKIFVIAEAKHHIDYEKIRYKLHQFDILDTIFRISNLYYKSINPNEIISQYNLKRKFIATIINEKKKFSNIYKSIIFFGASFWEDDLLQNLESDIKKRNGLIIQFKNESIESPRKIDFYRKICQIENKWYNPGQAPNNINLDNESIKQLTEIYGALNHVNFIKPSGERYKVEEEREPVGFAFGGKRKTQRRKDK